MGDPTATTARSRDAPARWLYRRHVIAALQKMVEPLERRGRLPASMDVIRRVRTIRAWDDLIVAPRFGFATADAYYASESVGPRLGALSLPSLYVGAEHDPMVTVETVRPSLDRASAALDVRFTGRAGHVGFPADLDLGERAPHGLEPQILAWLERHLG